MQWRPRCRTSTGGTYRKRPLSWHFWRMRPGRVDEMLKKSAKKNGSADAEFRPAPVPDTKSLDEVAAASKRCRACPLYLRGTQTVFGEGPKRAPMLLIGEQPGDQEDLAGKPFV